MKRLSRVVMQQQRQLTILHTLNKNRRCKDCNTKPPSERVCASDPQFFEGCCKELDQKPCVKRKACKKKMPTENCKRSKGKKCK